jgi:hypothetical protein
MTVNGTLHPAYDKVTEVIIPVAPVGTYIYSDFNNLALPSSAMPKISEAKKGSSRRAALQVMVPL